MDDLKRSTPVHNLFNVTHRWHGSSSPLTPLPGSRCNCGTEWVPTYYPTSSVMILLARHLGTGLLELISAIAVLPGYKAAGTCLCGGASVEVVAWQEVQVVL